MVNPSWVGRHRHADTNSFLVHDAMSEQMVSVVCARSRAIGTACQGTDYVDGWRLLDTRYVLKRSIASILVTSKPAAISSLSRSSTIAVKSGSLPRAGIVLPAISGK